MGAELGLFDTVHEEHARAQRDARESNDSYVIPPGGTTPLGTLGFVSAGLELAEDVRAGRAPDARRTRAGAAKLRAIHDETFARARARAHARAHDADGWDLDPVYSGKALAALLDDMHSDPPGRGSGPLLFWNTMSSRAVAIADVPAAFRRFAR